MDWQIVFTKCKEDKMEYAKANIPEYFSFFRENVGDGPALDARGANRNTLRSKKLVQDGDSVEKTICFEKNKSRSKDKEGASASRKLDSAISRLEGDIENAGSVSGPNLNLHDLQ